MGKSRDDAVASLSGEAKQKRLIATGLGVDPYTDFKPLADRLDELAGAAAVGNLAVSGAFMAVPGAAGVVVSNTSTAGTLNGMVSDYSSAQLMDINRDKLARLGVDGATANRLFANPNYTPVDVTAMVDALTSIGAVRDLPAMVARPPPPTAARPPISSAAGWSSPRPGGVATGRSPLSPTPTASGSRWPRPSTARSSASIRSTSCRGRRRPRGRSMR